MKKLLSIFGMLILVGALFFIVKFHMPNSELVFSDSAKDLIGDSLAGQEVDELSYYIESKAKKWGHMPLTYNSESCKDVFEGKMYKDIDNAVVFIEERTSGIIRFEKTEEEADITYICDIGGQRLSEWKPGSYTFAEAQPFYLSGSNSFSKGDVYIYASYDCLGKRPVLIIHETLHLLGLEHNTNPSYTNDIMHPFIQDNCNKADILQKDIDFLKETYRDL